MWRGALRAREQAEVALAPLGLRARHYGLMAILTDTGPASQRRIATQAGIDASRVVTLVDEMERLQFVRRLKDPSDRRAYLVDLTPAGKKLFAEARTATAAGERTLLAGLTAAERKQFVRLLGVVAGEGLG